MDTFFKIEGMVFLQYILLIIFVIIPSIIIPIFLIKVGRINYKVWGGISIVFYLTISSFLVTKNDTEELVNSLKTNHGLQIFEGIISLKEYIQINKSSNLRIKYRHDNMAVNFGNETLHLYPHVYMPNSACYNIVNLPNLYGRYVKFYVKWIQSDLYDNLKYACVIRIDVKK